MKPYRIYRHRIRGTRYRILWEGQFQIQDDPWLDESAVIVYQDLDTDRVYVRPKKEFYDGRFQDVGQKLLDGPVPDLIEEEENGE